MATMGAVTAIDAATAVNAGIRMIKSPSAQRADCSAERWQKRGLLFANCFTERIEISGATVARQANGRLAQRCRATYGSK
jgi:hypothetical protein